MARFFYRVKNKQNKVAQGFINASGISEAALKLEKQGYTILEIKEEFRNTLSNKGIILSDSILPFSLQEKKEFFNSFYFLYKSALPVLDIFKSIANSSTKQQVKLFSSYIVKKIEKGKSLKEAMANYSNVLGKAYTALIVAGEQAGKLDEILSDILINIKREEEIKSNLIAKLTYPTCIFFMAIAVALLFKFFILKAFSLMGTGVCFSALFMLLVTAIIKIIVIFAVFLAGCFYIYKNKRLFNHFISFILNIRIFGNLMKCYYFLNFFSVFSLAYSAGITSAESINLSASVINVPEINNKLKKAENMVYNGCEVATALGVTGLFSSYAMSQITAGEKAGELDKMLKTVALDYKNKLEVSMNVLLQVVEPIMLIFVGIIVAMVAVNGYKAYFGSLFSMF